MTATDDPVITPGSIVLTLILMGISTLFAGLCAAYIYSLCSGTFAAPRPPLIFFINIPVLLIATNVLRKARAVFLLHDHPRLVRFLVIAVIFTMIFITLQIIGWIQFFRDIPIAATQARSFLFVLSLLHLLHIVAGMPFLFWFLWKSKSEISLLFFGSAFYRGYLRGLCRYWRYLDILWIVLVTILTAGHLIRWS
jgi:cytochrome c oxidase subunit 3